MQNCSQESDKNKSRCITYKQSEEWSVCIVGLICEFIKKYKARLAFCDCQKVPFISGTSMDYLHCNNDEDYLFLNVHVCVS